MRLPRFLTPQTTVSAHCDLPCGVYDPAQARYEAQSVKAMQEKYLANEDPVFRARALKIIDDRATICKHHLAVLWHDYFKAEHFEKYPQLHMLINNTIKQASGTGAKQKMDPAEGQKLLDGIDEIAAIFWETKGKTYEKPAA
ncbi:MAG: nickel-containing superoxide dismutase [Frankiales bacterium]|jgi:nickel superoxide dismutase|nr:nickel-containing superoxide dismutase [Frankiales bacterium]